MSDVSTTHPYQYPQVDPADIAVSITPITVEVSISGSPGPAGPPSTVPGPPGPGGGQRYTHTQAMLSPTWIVQHDLNCHPVVTAEDGVGNVITGTVTYLDNNVLTVGFAYSITGRANCV